MEGEFEQDAFKWGDLDHKSIEKQLGSLKWTIKREIKAAEVLLPIPDHPTPESFKTPRQAHSFEVLQEERADDWVTRAYKIYSDDWQAKGGQKTQQFVIAVWCNALYYFVNEDVLEYLRLAFCVDDRAKKLLGREYSGLSQSAEAHARVSAVNRVYQNILKLWQEKKIPEESTALKDLIAMPNSPNPNLLKVGDLAPVGSIVTTAYDRTNEKNLKLRWTPSRPDDAVRQELLKELTEQQRLAKELAGLQGPHLAIRVFGRTDLEIREEIQLLEIGPTANPSSCSLEDPAFAEPVPIVTKPVFSHSEPYDSITFNGLGYTLHERQARVIRLLHEALKKGHPNVSTRKLLSLPGCEDVTAVRDIFKSRPELWGKLIVNSENTGEGRGFYRLHNSIKE
jgi:hypothetical protein